MKSEETRILYKFCAAVLEAREKQPYKTYIAESLRALPIEDEPPAVKNALGEAIILNLLNNRKNSYEALVRRLGLPVGKTLFTKFKTLFASELAARCGFSGQAPKAQSWTKTDVLNMLYSIAGEANECITDGEGSFNHQVAGVALKAIDQAVRLSGMANDDIAADESIQIEISQDADLLGA